MRKDSWKKIWNHPSCKAIREMSEEEALYCPLRREKTAEGKEALISGKPMRTEKKKTIISGKAV